MICGGKDRANTVAVVGTECACFRYNGTFSWRRDVSDLVKEIGANRQHGNFSSELRLLVLEFYGKQGAS